MKLHNILIGLILVGLILFGWLNMPDRNAPVTQANTPIAVVVPHHDIAAKLIDDILSEAASRNPNTKNIVLIGPDHKAITEQHILTSDKLNGSISVNQENVQIILDNKYAKLDPEKISAEHSVGVVAPVISKHFPNAQITPVVISSSTTKEMLGEYLKTLSDLYSENTLYIASVDFSHYLDEATAEKRDEETLEVILSKDYEKIMQFNHENMDSPESIWGIMKVAEIHRKNKIEVLAHNNSTDFGGTDTNVTTYFGLIFK